MTLTLRVAVILLPFLLTASEDRLPKIGQPAPPLTLKSVISGEVPTWEILKGTPVVLEFWGTWCAPCVSAIPHLNELAGKFKGVRFISITDDSPEVIEKFRVQHPIEGVLAFDDEGATHNAYGVAAYPNTMLVDASGIVRAVITPSQLTEALLNDLASGRSIPSMKLEGNRCISSMSQRLSESKDAGAASIQMGAGTWTVRNVPLKALVASAFQMPEERITVPGDIAALRYNMSIKLRPRGADPRHFVRLMLERYLKMRRDGENNLIVESVDLNPPRPK